MRCPICQAELLPVRDGATLGRLPGRPELDLKAVIGYNCPTQTDLPAGAQTPHYTVRGTNEIVTLFPYRVSTRNKTEKAPGRSLIYHYTEKEKRFTHVTETPLVKWDNEEKMRQKLAIYILFS